MMPLISDNECVVELTFLGNMQLPMYLAQIRPQAMCKRVLCENGFYSRSAVSVLTCIDRKILCRNVIDNMNAPGYH